MSNAPTMGKVKSFLKIGFCPEPYGMIQCIVNHINVLINARELQISSS